MHPATVRYARELYLRLQTEARHFLLNEDLLVILDERSGNNLPPKVDQAFEVFSEWMFANQPDGRENQP